MDFFVLSILFFCVLELDNKVYNNNCETTFGFINQDRILETLFK